MAIFHSTTSRGAQLGCLGPLSLRRLDANPSKWTYIELESKSTTIALNLTGSTIGMQRGTGNTADGSTEKLASGPLIVGTTGMKSVVFPPKDGKQPYQYPNHLVVYGRGLLGHPPPPRTMCAPLQCAPSHAHSAISPFSQRGRPCEHGEPPDLFGQVVALHAMPTQ